MRVSWTIYDKQMNPLAKHSLLTYNKSLIIVFPKCEVNDCLPEGLNMSWKWFRWVTPVVIIIEPSFL